jgi:hypothetical protein
MIESTLYSIITADPGITALIGTRAYPVILPTDPTLPAITYKLIGGSSRPTMDTSGMQQLRLEVDCWGATYNDAVTLRAAVFNALSEYFDPVANVYIQAIMPRDLFDSALLKFRAMYEFYVFYTKVCATSN